MSKIDDTKYIDFSDCKVTQQTYGGVDGDKIGIIYKCYSQKTHGL